MDAAGMNKRRTPLRACLMLMLTVTGLASAYPAGAQRLTLYDSRVQTPEPRLTESERGRVKYLAGQAAAQSTWARAGEVAMAGCTGGDFTVVSVASGAFTVKGARQTAYLYAYCYERPGDFQGLVVVQGSAVVAHYVFVDHLSAMYAMNDVNRNGFTELVLSGGFTGQGATEGWLELAELGPVRRLLGQLNYDHAPQPYLDNCGAVEIGGTWSSRVVRVVPGKVPNFTQQAISGRCGNERVATSLGPVRPLALKPAPTGWTSAPLK